MPNQEGEPPFLELIVPTNDLTGAENIPKRRLAMLRKAAAKILHQQELHKDEVQIPADKLEDVQQNLEQARQNLGEVDLARLRNLHSGMPRHTLGSPVERTTGGYGGSTGRKWPKSKN